MQDYEKLGVFYLGRLYDPKTRTTGQEPLLYDSKDLTTHAVCVGMTGSGKTGLCLGILEEAGIDGIPALIIDPKGDLSNLLLTFPDLSEKSFLPWINEEEARIKGQTPEEYAAQQADLWRRGLGDWGQTGERIRRLRDAAEFRVYTPGSNAGLQVSLLKSFDAPSPALLQDSDFLRERIGATAACLLGLLGMDADPLRSREHILISTILDRSWRQGQNLDVAQLIQQIQNPPVTRVGVIDMESFFPSKDRFELALMLNNLLAAPGFETWMEGEPLDIQQMLHSPQGKPRLSIFSIAHLNDAERMFVVSLLLNQTLAWARTLPGTGSLRAILYMDEIFGYFPPVANPPSKAPLLTLLKQARAFGLGVVLATQNPVDLDYKGLSNTGTWFIGRLQTERDKARVLDGLEGAAGRGFDRQATEQILAGLGQRVFLMNNVHEETPVLFQTRWTLSYLRGPLTRGQIRTLVEKESSAADLPGASAPKELPTRSAAPTPTAGARPILPPGIEEYFIPTSGSQRSHISYQPRLMGSATVRFKDAKSGVDTTRQVLVTTPITGEAVAASWEQSEELDIQVSDLGQEPLEGAPFAELPAAAAKVKNYGAWSRDFARWLSTAQKLELLRSPVLGVIAAAEESERDFRIRLQLAAREQRDQSVESLRKKFAARAATLQERLRRAEQAADREASEARQQQIQTAVSLGTTILGAFLGRKTFSASSLGRATTTARGVGRILKEQQDIGRAGESVAALRQQAAELEAELQSEVEVLSARLDPLSEKLETIVVSPKKTDIAVQLVALAWIPAEFGDSHR